MGGFGTWFGEGLDRGESEGGDKGMCQLVEGKRKKG